MKKIPFFPILVLLVSMSLTVCCTGTDTKMASMPGHINPEHTPSGYSGCIPAGNAPDVPVLSSGSILTNASYVAQIAFCNTNVNEMLHHGSSIMGIIDFMPSRPKTWNLITGPALWTRYRDIDVYFYVNETGATVDRFEIVVPGTLYQKQRLEIGTCLLDTNGTEIVLYNKSTIRILEGQTCHSL